MRSRAAAPPNFNGKITIVTAPQAVDAQADAGSERLARAVLGEVVRLTGQRRLYDFRTLPVPWRTAGPPDCDH